MKGLFVSDKQQRANQAIHKASAKVDEIESDIQQKVTCLEEQCKLHRRLLHDLVSRASSKKEIMTETQRVTMLMKQLDVQRNLLSNMHREKRQLASASLNTSVASVMRESLDAQKLLSLATCKGIDIDDVLDDAEETRSMTAELSDRLAAVEEETIEDTTAFDLEQIKRALDMDRNHDEEIGIAELHALVVPVEDSILEEGSYIMSHDELMHDDFPCVPQKSRVTTQHGVTWNF